MISSSLLGPSLAFSAIGVPRFKSADVTIACTAFVNKFAGGLRAPNVCLRRRRKSHSRDVLDALRVSLSPNGDKFDAG